MCRMLGIHVREPAGNKPSGSYLVTVCIAANVQTLPQSLVGSVPPYIGNTLPRSPEGVSTP